MLLAAGSPPASFRLRLGADTLALSYGTTTFTIGDSHPLDNDHTGRATKRALQKALEGRSSCRVR